jgi:hypothetical protein
MSLLSVFLAAAVVVLQATLILSNRKPNLWVFSLLQKRRSPPDWNNISSATGMPDKSQDISFHESILKSEANTPLVQCLERARDAADWPPDYCPFWSHAPQKVSSIFGGSTWNPHLILLAITCVHFVAILSCAQAEHHIKTNSVKTLYATTKQSYASRMYQFPLSLCLCILFMLWLIVGLIASNRNFSHTNNVKALSILDTPTVIVSVLLFISCAWFVHIHHQYNTANTTTTTTQSAAHDIRSSISSEAEHANDDAAYYLWNQSFQLQMIAVPLTVVITTVMGVRLFTDIITHFVLLSAAVNALWLQRSLFTSSQRTHLATNNILFLLLKVITVGIPLYCLFAAQAQWGKTSTWQQIAVFIAYFSLAPLLAFSLLSTAVTDAAAFDDQMTTGEWKKMQSKIGSISSIAALGGTVINLALL